MSEVLETLYKPIDISIDVEVRKGHIKGPDLVESTGRPIPNPFTGGVSRSRIHLPEDFEYTYAEMGTASSKTHGVIALHPSDSYGQFNELHMNQDGVIR